MRIRQGMLMVTGAMLLAAAGAVAETPELAFDESGLGRIQWRGAVVSTRGNVAVESVVLEVPDDGPEALWGARYRMAPVAEPVVTVDRAARRVLQRYPWGTVTADYTPQPGRLTIGLTIQNTGPHAIADLRVRLLELALRDPPRNLLDGQAFYTLDRPHWYKLPVRGGHVFATSETFDTPFLFGLDRGAGGARDATMALFLRGGVPADKGESLMQPLLGTPHIAAGQTLELTFVLRFAAPEEPDIDILQPYLEAFRAAQGEAMTWLDRRPIGRLVIPGSPNRVTVENPRGWFDDPRLDTGSVEGQAAFRERLMALADRTLEALAAAGAQGVVVWNLEGRHIYPAYPMGDPRQLEAIAPEMDAVADAFFARFREAGYRTGLTIRPQNLYLSARRQNWAHGTGAYDPERESFPGADAALAGGLPPERVYPLVERLSDKIRYARERWGCTLFFIENNGAWRQATPGGMDEWMLFDARVLRKLREQHPDVLLIPRYAERFWRPARTSALQTLVNRHKASRERQPQVQAPDAAEGADAAEGGIGGEPLDLVLRGLGEDRVGGLPTPDWVAAHYLVLDRHRWFHASSAFSGPRHILREAYWANAAPFIRMNQKERIVEYLLTLDQHTSYDRDAAEKLADTLVPFEQTPAPVRDWLPDAFSVKDLTGAGIAPRRDRLVRGAAWGDVLMWDVGTDPGAIRAMMAAAAAKQQRVHAAARRIGMLPAEEAAAERLPVSLVWRRGEPLDASLLVSGTAPPDFRARIATSPDRRQALLMLAWRGGRGQRVRLNAGLPGIALNGAAMAAWCLDTGRYQHTGMAFDVDPDMTAGMSVLLLQAADRPAAALPPGILLGTTFAEGLAPVLGGTMPATATVQDGHREDGALQLAGADVRYNVVPEWLGGAVAFDIRPGPVDAAGLQVLRLRHHLDADLRLGMRDGRRGLLLTARETGADGADGQERTLFAALPGDAGRWFRAVLSWEMGQYELFVDGASAGIVSGPVDMRARDGSVMEPGLLLGDAADGRNRALLDGLVVYSRPLAAQALSSQRGRTGLVPLPPDERPLSVWLWGQFPRAVTVALNAREAMDWSRIETFEVKLYERLESGRLQVATARLTASGGTASGVLAFQRAQSAESDAGGGRRADRSADLMAPGRGAVDLTGLLGDDLALGDPYVLIVEAHGAGGRLLTRRVEFEAGPQGIDQHRW